MAGKARVHELAKELGKTSKEIMAKLTDMGEFVKSPSSTIEAPVVRKLRDAFPASKPAAKSDLPTNGSTGPRSQPAGGPGRPGAPRPAAAAGPAPSRPVTAPAEPPRLKHPGPAGSVRPGCAGSCRASGSRHPGGACSPCEPPAAARPAAAAAPTTQAPADGPSVNQRPQRLRRPRRSPVPPVPASRLRPALRRHVHRPIGRSLRRPRPTRQRLVPTDRAGSPAGPPVRWRARRAASAADGQQPVRCQPAA